MLRIAQNHAGAVAHPEHASKEVAFEEQRTCSISLEPGPGFHALIQPEFPIVADLLQPAWQHYKAPAITVRTEYFSY